MSEAKCGLYKIVNKNNNKFYIGSSTNLNQRWKSHKNALRRGAHINEYLQRSFNKHGQEAFEFVVLKQCTKANLLKEEQLMLDKHFGKKECYNLNNVAGRPPILIGAQNPMYKNKTGMGANNSRARAIIITYPSGVKQVFPYIKLAYELLGIHKATIYAALKRGFFTSNWQMKESLHGATIQYGGASLYTKVS